MNTRVYRVTFGMPEKHIPSAYAPAALVPVVELKSEQIPELSFSASRRGCKILLLNGTKIKGGTDVFTFDNLTDYAQGNEINIEIVYDSAENVQKYLNTNFALVNGIVVGVGGVLLLTAGLVTVLLIKKKKRANSKEST